MRKMFFVLTVIVVSTCCFAQNAENDKQYIRKDMLELYPRVSYFHAEYKGTEIEKDNVEADVSLGFCVTDFLEVGLDFGVNYSSLENDATNAEVSSTTLLAGPTVTLNVPTKTRFVPFLNGSFGLAYSCVDVENNTTERSEDEASYYWRIGGGLRTFLSDSVSVNVGVGYFETDFDEEWSEIEAVYVGLGMSFFF